MKHGEPINKSEFEKMCKKYKDKNPKGTQAVLFGRDSIQRVLDTPGAAGIRIYLGENEDGDVTTILVPADDKGQNIFQSLEDRGQLCPPYCP